MRRNGSIRITKQEFYNLGGFANSNLYRIGTRNGSWKYYRTIDNDQ